MIIISQDGDNTSNAHTVTVEIPKVFIFNFNTHPKEGLMKIFFRTRTEYKKYCKLFDPEGKLFLSLKDIDFFKLLLNHNIIDNGEYLQLLLVYKK